MNILIVGASQGTGAHAVAAAIARGHTVTAFARTPQRLALDHPSLRRVAGSVHDAAAVEAVVAGHDAVIVTASSTLKGLKAKPDFFSDGTRKVIDAMRTHGVRCLVILSALGTGDSRGLLAWPLRVFMVDGLLKVGFADHEVQEKMVRESGLDWVIARPGRLTDGPAHSAYVAKTQIEALPGSIARADVGAFLVRAVEEPEWVGHNVQLGG